MKKVLKGKKKSILYKSPSKKNIDISLINSKMKQMLSSKRVNSIIFTIDKNPSQLDIFEKIYHFEQKKYKYKEKLNHNIILMLHNYIITIQNVLINEKYFTEVFMTVIQFLFINEIELTYMTLVLDKIGLEYIINEISEYLHYIGLAIKEKTSYEMRYKSEGEVIKYSHYSLLFKIENKRNNTFKANYENWIINSNIKEILQKIDKNTEIERFRKLKLNNINIYKKHININDIVNKIVQNMETNDINIDIGICSNINYNTNNNNNYKLKEECPLNTKLDRINTFSVQNPIKQPTSNLGGIESFNPIGEFLNLKINNSFNPEDSSDEIGDFDNF